MAKGTKTRSIRIPDELWEDVLLLTSAREETATGLVIARFEQYRKRHAEQLAALKAGQ